MEEDFLARRLHKYNAKHGEAFNLWSLRLEALLESKDLIGTVTTDPMQTSVVAQLPPKTKSKVLKAKVIAGSVSWG